MSLSEHEQRILDQIEQQLSQDDPGWAERVVKRSGPDSRGRRLRASIAGFLVGFACLLGITFSVVWGVIGFTLMFVSTVVGIQAMKGSGRAAQNAVQAWLRKRFEGHQDAN